MNTQCPNNCHNRPHRPKIQRYGQYFRKSDGKYIHRFRCTHCRLHFSQATFSNCFRQNKRHLNYKILTLQVSGVSQRRIAKLLNVSQITVARKLEFLGRIKRHENYLFRLKRVNNKVHFMQFDDLETIEHSKMKPLSITLAVEKDSRYILGFEVSRMPAKGLLAKKARKKYGPRKDERKEARQRLFRRLVPVIDNYCEIQSDSNPHYLEDVIIFFSNANRLTVEGKRGAVTGQGELKKVFFDPIFSLNHTCAMFRANVNRLFRKTWCTTKKIQPLIDHLEIYTWYHNQKLLINKR